MAATSAPSADSQSLYDNQVKNECRRRLIEHAVKHLTTERDSSVCVRRGHVKKVWRQLHETKDAFDCFSDEQKKDIEEEISRWEKFHKSNLLTKKPSDLRVCYLAGDNPTNDFQVLYDLGIIEQNVWAVEKNPAVLGKALKSIQQSKFHNFRLFRGDILDFLKTFEGQFDIIYFDACGSLPSAKQKTLTFIGYVFLYNKLKSPGALITTFSFPPQEAKPADPERLSIKELSVEYLKHRFTNVLHNNGTSPEEIASYFNQRTDEENYSDYITYQVIDSAYLYIPIRRMLTATKHGSSSSFWDQIYEKKRVFFEAVSDGLNAATATGLNSQSTSDETAKCFFEAIKESYLQQIALIFQEKSPTNELCEAWITELFPDLGVEKNRGIASLLLTHLLSYSFIFITKFANKDLKKYCLDPLFDVLQRNNSFPSFFDEPNLESTTSMVTGLLYGQMAYPSFPVVDKLFRLGYKAHERYKRQMFSDVFIFDQCRYVFEQFPTVAMSTFALNELHQQMVIRMVVDGLHKHIGRICKLDVFPGCNVTSIKAIVDGGVEFHSTALPSIPNRQRVEELMLQTEKNGNALAKE